MRKGSAYLEHVCKFSSQRSHRVLEDLPIHPFKSAVNVVDIAPDSAPLVPTAHGRRSDKVYAWREFDQRLD
jgi:hypothetical protein